jgi:gamma-glutamylcyclotransferase (GGCT)/AIG2-like uncharacterized protein YtfP
VTAIAFYGTSLPGYHRALPDDWGEYGPECLIRGSLYDAGSFAALAEGDDLTVGRIWTPRANTRRAFGVLIPSHGDFERRVVSLSDPRGLKVWVFFYRGDVSKFKRVASGDWRAYVSMDRKRAA